MAIIDEEQRLGSRRLSRALRLAVTARGVELAPVLHHPSMELSYADVELIGDLAADAGTDVEALADEVATRTGAEVDRLLVTARALAERTRLVPVDGSDAPDARQPGGPASSLWTPAPVAEPPSPSPAPVREHEWFLLTPFVVLPTVAGFAVVDHDGDVMLTLTARELVGAVAFSWPITVEAAMARNQVSCGDRALSLPDLIGLAERLRDAGLLVPAPSSPHATAASSHAGIQWNGSREMERLSGLIAASDRNAEIRRKARVDAPVRRPLVVTYQRAVQAVPLALGMVMAYAKVHENGRLRDLYDFEPYWFAGRPAVRSMLNDGPAVFLFSNYVWSHGENMRTSAMVKRISPESITIHGGPDTPKYEADTEAYLRDHPEVDIVIRGEGELTCAEVLDALGGRLAGRNGDLSDLRDVAGIAFRDGDEIVRTPDRPRIADLDILPSPYLTGLFQEQAEATVSLIILETNRGCPYGCTFCDWGSATQSRIRKFSMERVVEELEWIGRNKMPRLFIADANFGIFERDVEIAEHLKRINAEHGSPTRFQTSFAKNTVKHTRRIVASLVDAGMITEASIALQSADPDTLLAVNRSNIRTDKYRELAREFRGAGLPLYVDLMMGLPGATLDSFKADLQDCVDHELPAKLYRTELLVNSPMNAPTYLEEHAIETESVTDRRARVVRKLLVSTSTYSRDDYLRMERIRRTFTVFDNYVVLRLVARFVRQELGIKELDFYIGVDDAVHTDPERFPSLTWAAETAPELLTPPGSWRYATDEIARYVVDDLGLEPSTALAALLRAQHALIPAPGRVMPVEVRLEHDVVAWYQAMVEAKDVDEGTDWVDRVPRLGTYGPGVLAIEDPNDLCYSGLGYSFENDSFGAWDMVSAITRPTPRRFGPID